MEQENFLLVPMELTRIVSVLIHGGDAEHEEKYAEAFQQASSLKIEKFRKSRPSRLSRFRRTELISERNFPRA